MLEYAKVCQCRRHLRLACTSAVEETRSIHRVPSYRHFWERPLRHYVVNIHDFKETGGHTDLPGLR
jgi:hypothetical protein